MSVLPTDGRGRESTDFVKFCEWHLAYIPFHWIRIAVCVWFNHQFRYIPQMSQYSLDSTQNSIWFNTFFQSWSFRDVPSQTWLDSLAFHCSATLILSLECRKEIEKKRQNREIPVGILVYFNYHRGQLRPLRETYLGDFRSLGSLLPSPNLVHQCETPWNSQ